MNFKGNLKRIIIGSVAFLIIYMFVAAVPMGDDIYFAPDWTRDISSPVEIAADQFPKESVEAFALANRFGYFTADGKILSSSTTDSRVSISPVAWTTYPENASNTEIRNPDGSARCAIAESGFVHLDEGRAYLFLPGGAGVSMYSESGTRLWVREHTAPITAFNSSPKGTVIGYSDGLLTYVKPDGNALFSFYPGGSDYEVILGAAISEDGSLVACVSGIDAQRVVLIRVSGVQHKVVFHEYLKGNLRRQAFVDFEETGAYAFFEYEGGLGIIDCAKNKARFIPFDGQILKVGEKPGSSLFVALVKSGAKYTLAAIDPPGTLVASSDFAAKDAFLVQRGDAVYLGADERISKITIRGRK